MAKALFGHVGVGQDLRMAAEMRRLRQRVRDLEDEVDRLHAAGETLGQGIDPATTVVDDVNELIALSVPETALSVPEVEPALT